MYKVDFQKKWVSFILSLFLIFSLAVGIVPQTVLAESASPYQKIITDESERQITMAIFPVAPPKIKVAVATVPDVHIAGAINTLSNVPAFDWSYGCSATSAAMLFGYYDHAGYSNMYTGPTNGGVCPLDNSIWGHTTWPSVTCGECPLSATHNGIDGRTINGHVDDYWIDLGQTGPDPWVGHWTEHTSDCAGDYMGTNQAKYSNTDGSTTFFWWTNGDPLYDYTGREPTYRDGCHGMKLFAQSRGYTVLTNFTQLIKGQGTDPTKGFTFDNFQAEIDAGHPVLIQLVGHTMLGYGYDTIGNIIYVHNTWDYSNHQMTWGGTYVGMQHSAVTVIRLNPSQPPPAAPVLKSPTSGSTVPTLTPRLEWNASSGAVSYGVQVSTSPGFTSLIVNEVGIANLYYDIAPGILNWDTTYYWRVNAKNSFGSTSSWSSYSYFKTAVGLPPNAPSDLIATTISSSQINLTWQDNSSDEAGFKIERKTGSGSYSQIATVGASVTSYSNTGLTASTTYYYRVRAYSVAGNSDYSNEASATTLPPPPAAPVLKSPANRSTVPSLTPRLEWNASTGATDYGLQVAITSSFTSLVVDETGITDLFYDVSEGTLNWNTIYYWRVNAKNSLGSTSTWSRYRYFRTAVGPPPEAPSDLVATAISSSRIDLSWQDNSSDEAGFKIERKTGSGSYSQIATVGADVTNYSDSSRLSAGTTYYRVRAYKRTLNSDYCEEASATILPPPPAASVLKSPANRSTVPSLTPRLEPEQAG
ncbi:MAG: fibronectin type III domain-containing protein [Dehalococcoidia bacterium]